MKSKFICFFVAIVFAVSLCANWSSNVYAYADDMVEYYFSVMVDLGFVDGNISPSENMTRGEFCDVIFKAANLPHVAVNSVYFDVPETHTYVDSICSLTELKYVEGNGENLFYPDEYIDLDSAAKIIAKINGFDAYAELMGGYPTGYRLYAAKYGILKGISDNDCISRASAACMIYNMLTSEYMTVSGESTLSSSGKPMLVAYHNIDRYEGFIYSTGMTAINGESICKSQQIVLKQSSGRKLTMNIAVGNDYEEYLGRKVIVYAQESNGIYTLKSIAADTTEYTIDILDIQKAENGKIEYYNNSDKLKYVKVSEYADYIYNGKADLKFNFSDINTLKAGSLNLIDNDDDNVYEIVIIQEYRNFILDAADSRQNLLFDMNSNVLEVDEAYKNNGLQIVCNGENIPVDALKRWDVITYFMSRDMTCMKLFVTRKSISGDVTYINKSNNEYFINIGNAEYEVSEDCYNFNGIELSSWGVFHLDFFGKVAAFDIRSNDNVYGYLMGAALEGAFSDNVKFKIFTESGETVILESAKKVLFNEEVKYTGIELYEQLQVLGNGVVCPQLIRYDYTDDGKLTKLSVAQNVSDYDKFRMSDKLSSAQCSNSNNITSFASKYIIGSSTKVFCVPKVVDGNADTDVLRVLDKDYFENNLTYTNLEFYDVDETKVVGLMAYVVSDDIKKLENKIFCVKKVKKVLTHGGDIKSKLDCVSGSVSEAYFADEGVLDNCVVYGSNSKRMVEGGDIVRLAFDSKGEISDVVIYESCIQRNDISQYETSLDSTNSGMNSAMVICKGILSNASDEAFTVEIDGSLSEYIYPMNSSTRIFIYNSRANEFQSVSKEYFASNSGKEIFVCKRYDIVTTVVMLESE